MNVLMYVEFASRYNDACRIFHSNDLSILAKDKEGHNVDDYSATEHEINEECRKNMNVAANERTLPFATTSSETVAVDTQHKQRGRDTRQIMTNRLITVEHCAAKLVKMTTCHHNKRICITY